MILFRKIRLPFLLALILSLSVLSSCASVSSVAFERDKDFYYGAGTVKTSDEAEMAAKIDLISSALQTSITEEMAKSFSMKGLKPFIKEKTDDGVSVVYRISREDWNKLEEPRQEALRGEINSSYELLVGGGQQDVALRLADAAGLLARLSREGVYAVLKDKEKDGILLSTKISSYSSILVSSLKTDIIPGDFFIDDNTLIEITFTTQNGNKAISLPISTKWKSSEMESLPSVLITDATGKITIAFPDDDLLKNRSVQLSLTVALSDKGGDALFLKDAEKASEKEITFRHFDDAKAFFTDEVKIPGGSFVAGAVKQDNRAESKEAPRKANVNDFYMDRYPVTNEMYRVYLEDMKIPAAEYPIFLGNEDYNKAKQPVIGVSQEDAKKYALWLNGRFGSRARLPVEDEWEKAAHGGITGIFPWGDQKPVDAVFANYNGNGLFQGTSPVGSFEKGKNAYGLYDMAGNVSQWTTTLAPGASDAGSVIVKGGSWMDGQGELRISARRYVDPSGRYGDVGFRLVREISNE
jgi:hypothetical protein